MRCSQIPWRVNSIAREGCSDFLTGATLTSAILSRHRIRDTYYPAVRPMRAFISLYILASRIIWLPFFNALTTCKRRCESPRSTVSRNIRVVRKLHNYQISINRSVAKGWQDTVLNKFGKDLLCARNKFVRKRIPRLDLQGSGIIYGLRSRV